MVKEKQQKIHSSKKGVHEGGEKKGYWRGRKTFPSKASTVIPNSKSNEESSSVKRKNAKQSGYRIVI